MPTDFMNRRMDLIHSVFDAGPGVGLVNYLTMDTSYPVKLSGKVIKVFKAANVYNDGMWVIVNAADQGILTISSRNLYDFSGNVIENCVGEEKLYPTSEDVYKADDYVVIIIDFDNESAKICSQTMFDYIFSNVGVSDVNLKMFDISGTDIVPGIDDPLSQEEFDKAISFETGDGTFAFVRRNNSDKVVFQAMEKDEDGNYRYVPVSDVINKNINGFNVSALPLLYPSLNTGYYDSFFTCGALKSMVQLNGKVNEKFIQDYCYTYSEIQAFIAGPGRFLEEYSKYYYDNIPDESKNDYYYFIRDNSADDSKYSVTVKSKRQSQMIIPILKDTLKFNTVEFNGPNIQTSNMELNLMHSQISGNITGNWWSSGFKASDTGSNQAGKSIWSKPQTVRYTDDSENVVAYAFDINGVSGTLGRSFYLTEYISSAPNILTNGVSYYEAQDSQYPNINTTEKYMVATTDEIAYAHPDFIPLSQYINCFRNDDPAYEEYIKWGMLRGAYQDNSYAFMNKSQYDNSPTDNAYSPMRVAMVCNEYIKNYIFAGQSLWNLCDNDNINKDIVCYSELNDSWNLSEAYYMLYVMSFYTGAYINNFNNKLNFMKNSGNATRKITRSGTDDYKFVFKVTGDFLLRSDVDGNSPFGICTHKKDNGDTVNYLIYQFVKLMPKAIAPVVKDDKERYLADMSFVTKAYVDEIKFAKADFDDHLEYVNENGTDYLVHVSKSDTSTNLYMTKYSDGALSLVRASYAEVCNAITYNGTLFLYMGDSGVDITANTNTSVYRLRYYTDFSTVSSYANHTSDPNDAFTDIDFFTKPIRVCVKDTTESYSLYDRAYAATRTEATSAADLLTAVKNAALVDRITTVEYEYGLYKNGTTYGIMNKLDAEGIPTVIDKSHPHVAGINSNTIMLAIDYSNHIKDYRNSQDTTLMDLLPNGTIPYTNGPAPELSRAKGKNGAFIINSASYADFISNVFVSKPTNNMENNLTGTDPIPAMLSEEQLKYVNGVGIREEYYKNKTIFEFLNNLTMYDVTKPSETQKQDVVRVSRNPVYSKGVFDTITGTEQYTDFKEDFIYNNVKAVTNGAQFKIPSGINIKAYATRTTSTVSETLTNCSCSVVNCSYNDRIQVTVHRSGTSPTYWVNFSDIAERYTGFKDSNGDQVTMYAPITIVSKINFRNNKYGFNEAYIYSGTTSDTQDLTSYYISVDKIFASTEKAGEKQVTNVSLCDENGVPLNLNGILGDVEVDDLNWDTLMTALSSNKTINILSVLKKVKGDLDSAVINAAQNITDKIAYANNIDNAASIGTKADFDSETNLYTYHDGEGYNNNVKEQNHRGVIVLVTEGGKTTLVNGVAVTTNPTIHVKRMYISKDGLLCTKEFYDAEKAIGKSLLERLHDLDHLG